MSACQHPAAAVQYGKDGALVCSACKAELVPGPYINPEVTWAVECPECQAPRFWACQRGYGLSTRTGHPGRWAALRVARALLDGAS